jgi:hypothetical protein
MFQRVNRLVAATALAVSASSALAGTAAAAPGPGTFTKITTPSHNITYNYNSRPGAINNLTVSGQTSLDVTSVDIVCMVLTHVGPLAQNFASAVPVTGGSFSMVVSIDNPPIPCVLRAVPTGVDPQTTPYLASYAGPLLHAYTFIRTKDAAKLVGYQTLDEVGSGVVVVSDAAQCGVNGLLTILMPVAELRGPGTNQFCSFALPASNVTNTGTATAPAVRVDNKNAYLPFSVSSYLRASAGVGGLGLTLPQSTVAATFTRDSNGDVTVTEVAPLKRCDGDNTYPPTSASCTTLIGTGVTFKRTINIIRGAHQVEIRDAYVSTDGHSHTVTGQYQFTAPGIDTGATGYIYPQHAAKFAKATFDKIVTGVGTGAGTVLARSDIYALSTDDQADTVAYTWSRPPAKIQFSHTSTSFFAMPYVFHVAAHGSASIRFAESEAPLTSDAKKLAAKAVADF